jgi:ribose 5-phosphate isomerase B
MKVGLANDHAGYQLKNDIKAHLLLHGYVVTDYGSDSDIAVDYADYAHKLAYGIENGDVELGISICGSGNGINITANKHQGIRSALCWIPEIGRLARAHNDANICALPGRFITKEQAIEIVNQFLNTPFEGGRHEQRINKIPITINK